MMKKYLLRITLFFLIVFVIDVIVGFWGDYLQTHAKRGETRRINSIVNVDIHDIIVFGSSRARYHYDAPFLSGILGLDVYNAGYEGRGVVFAYGLLSMIAERYQPKLIVLDINPDYDIIINDEDDNNRRYIRDLKPYWRESSIKSIICDVSMNEWYKVHSGMLRYNTVILQKVIDSYGENHEMEKGYIPLRGVYDWERNEEMEGNRDVETDPFKLEYLKRFIELAKNKSIPVLVVASPKYGEKSSRALNPVIGICSNYNIPFIDYWADKDFMAHKEWFNDPLHLNYSGARKFNEQIISDIEQLVVL